LGVSTKTLTATAVAAAASITGCQDNSVSNTVCSPYAAWRPGPACSGNYTDPEAGRAGHHSFQPEQWLGKWHGRIGWAGGGDLQL
jgi:hypothetical protein